MGWVIFAVVVCAYLYTFRFTTGWFMRDLGYPDDGLEWALMIILGVATSLLATVPVVICRPIYVLAKRYGPAIDGRELSKMLFPEPNRIESRYERAARKDRDRKRELQESRRRINELEVDAGLTPTRWDD